MSLNAKAPSSYSVCVFCSAVPVADSKILSEASQFSKGLAERKWRLVYGGGAGGLMGHFADEALSAGGKVLGIIPACLHDKFEVPHRGLTELSVVTDLFTRKQQMMMESDAFAIFPGGWGTLDEAFEVLTWKVLGQLDKPIVFFNINGFWDTTLQLFADLASKGMVRPGGFSMFDVVTNVEEGWQRLV